MELPEEAKMRAKAEQDFDTRTAAKTTELPGKDVFEQLFGLGTPYFFLFMSCLCLILYDWAWSWFLSGAPILCFAILLGRPGAESFTSIWIWTLLFNTNFFYALCSTSWLFTRFYRVAAFPTIAILLIKNSFWLQVHLRKTLRLLSRQFDFFEDKIAFFNIPAIDIDDGDVPCLLVIRGMTFTVSTMTLEVHGIEVGVKITDDLEISIQTPKLTWRLFRNITIADIYGNLKSEHSRNARNRFENLLHPQQPLKENITDDPKQTITNERAPQNVSDRRQISTKVLHPEVTDDRAQTKYLKRLRYIRESDLTVKARREIGSELDDKSENHRKALISTKIHSAPSVSHPPKTSIKSSWINNELIPQWLKDVFAKVPSLLRIFLNPVSYNHPVVFESIILSVKGVFIKDLIDTKFFKTWGRGNLELRSLQTKIDRYLEDSTFCLQLSEILGIASVPFLTQYDIMTHLKSPKLEIFKVCTKEKSVTEIASLDGVTASFTIPEYLLPNHEYLIPDPPEDLTLEDVANVKMSLLFSLPGTFAPEIVNFASLFLKATKVLASEKQATAMNEHLSGPVDFGHKLALSTKQQLKKGLVDVTFDDALIGKLILKLTKALKDLSGDVGYQTDIPVSLSELRSSRMYARRKPIRTHIRHDSVAESVSKSNAMELHQETEYEENKSRNSLHGEDSIRKDGIPSEKEEQQRVKSALRDPLGSSSTKYQ